MQQIARAAGVDPSTVSRVLSGKAGRARIGARTAERVLAAASRLGYRPNLAARALRTRRTQTLGLLVTELANPFFATIAGAVERAARAAGYSTLVATSGEEAEREAEYLAVLRARPVDGLIVAPAAGAQARSALAALVREGIPVVLIDRRVQGLDCDRVLVENRAAAARIVEELAALGARRLAMAGGPRGLWTADERLAGFREGLRTSGLEFAKSLTASGPFSTGTGLAAARKFLAARRPPDAIVAANNRILLGVLRALREAAEAAGDVAVGGFDGLPFAGLLGRPLVVAEQPREEIGRRATEMLVSRIEDPHAGKAREVVLDVNVRRYGPDSGPFELGA
jgi:LacI family transcriptional regulator